MVLRPEASRSHRLPDVAVTEAVDQILAKDCGVSTRKSLAVIVVSPGRGLSRELRRISNIVVLQVAAKEQAVIAILGDQVIQFCDVGVQVNWSPGRECESLKIQAV